MYKFSPNELRKATPSRPPGPMAHKPQHLPPGRIAVDDRNAREAGFDGGAGLQPLIEPAGGETQITAGFAQEQQLIKFKINPDLKYRRIYCAFGATLSVPGENYVMPADVQMIKGGRPVVTLPANRARDIASVGTEVLNASMISVFANSDQGANDAIMVEYAQSWNDDSAVLTPLRLVCVADEIVFTLRAGARVTTAGTFLSIRALLYVFSQNYPF